MFDTSGNFLRRLTQRGNLNAPWGLTEFDGELWVGNFGDGKINVYDPSTGAFIETLMRADGTPLQFDGLWIFLRWGTAFTSPPESLTKGTASLVSLPRIS